jgi:multidrug efflux pump subunit AcrA (membrane-fusion protein)
MSETNQHHISPLRIVLITLLLVALVAAVGLTGYLPRQKRDQAARAAAGEMKSSVLTVAAMRVRRAPEQLDIQLPGTTAALIEASIFARASGYVSKRYADIGDRVTEGQLLAEIETPELDQQAAQARAAVAQARQQTGQVRAALIQAEAQRDLAKITWERYRNLVAKGAVARQEADTQEAGFKSTEALVAAQQANLSAAEENVRQAQANLDRIVTLLDFRKVKAPFAGVITARNVEAGSLISAGGGGQGASPQPGSANGGASGNELFRVAQTGTLRILTSVPQSSMPYITVGMPAQIAFNEFRGRKDEGRVVRMSNSMDPNSRTMLVEIHLAYRDGKLYPGMYADVRFSTHRADPPLLVPGESIIAGNSGLQVAVLQDAGEGSKVHLQSIRTGRDYGTETEVVEGLEPGVLIVVGPGDEVREGVTVHAEIAAAGRGAANSTPSQGANKK